MKFPESKLAHAYLDGLKGLEIGGSAHNAFGLNTKNVVLTDENIFKQYEIELIGEKLAVDIIVPGDNIPLPDESQDFIINSHVLEHFSDPIKALKEWYRLIKKGGYLFLIIPHKERTFDKDRERTTLQELIDRHSGKIEPIAVQEHFSVWITEDIVELMRYLRWNVVFVQDVDDKVGNGFTVVVKKDELVPKEYFNIDLSLKEILFQKMGILVKDVNDINNVVYAAIANSDIIDNLQKQIENLNSGVNVVDWNLRESVVVEKQMNAMKREVDLLNQEMCQMKNSKFWRLRDNYLRIKSVFLGNGLL